MIQFIEGDDDVNAPRLLPSPEATSPTRPTE